MSGDLNASEKSVIGGYLNGNSYEKISKQNQIAKETVFNIIKGGRTGLLSQTLIL
jgi:Mor family transcriptional regulator